MKNPKDELTYLMVKPDGVKRGLTGEIIRRIEQRGLKVVGIKMIEPTREMIDDHYPKDEAWIKRIGQRTSNTMNEVGGDLQKELGTTDLLEVGKIVRGWLVNYMSSAPLVCVVIKGFHAVEMVRKIVGATVPREASIGTIRGDYSVDSPAPATVEKRAIFNLVHASETPEEAKHEIKHWFGDAKILDYDRTCDMV